MKGRTCCAGLARCRGCCPAVAARSLLLPPAFPGVLCALGCAEVMGDASRAGAAASRSPCRQTPRIFPKPRSALRPAALMFFFLSKVSNSLGLAEENIPWSKSCREVSG